MLSRRSLRDDADDNTSVVAGGQRAVEIAGLMLLLLSVDALGAVMAVAGDLSRLVPFSGRLLVAVGLVVAVAGGTWRLEGEWKWKGISIGVGSLKILSGYGKLS